MGPKRIAALEKEAEEWRMKAEDAVASIQDITVTYFAQTSKALAGKCCCVYFPSLYVDKLINDFYITRHTGCKSAVESQVMFQLQTANIIMIYVTEYTSNKVTGRKGNHFFPLFGSHVSIIEIHRLFVCFSKVLLKGILGIEKI